ncbi:response regulator receiver domain-containing protein [Roseiarcus fermentans]|uniref:Response regulator receiver domain-containing protein n=1 Tax=Roseiarcus fermentans TaxID=1473586 RepID=A0A366ENN9_9HYPH|nr:response regulator [Roseiarcus fermentans]RBP03109.1 response regulator receiver domain-containing protein [Roseiarcus fermentans]
MPKATPALKPCRIMLIEDDPDDVYLFQRALDRVKAGIGREVVLEVAGDGLDASYQISVEDLMSRLPDIVVLDLNMPRLDGVKFLHALRQTFQVKSLPVVVLTTSTAKPVHDEALAAGADAVFVKPDSADALLEIAAEIIDRGVVYGQPRS